MKKSFIFIWGLLGVQIFAQYEYNVGINTQKPRATLEVKSTEDNKVQGVLYPHISETEKKKWMKNDTKGLVAGTVIWNTTKECLDYFDGVYWKCLDGLKSNEHPKPWEEPNVGMSDILPEGIVFSNGTHWIVSVLDDNYFPFQKPDLAASWVRRSEPNTSGKDKIIDIKGVIPANGIEVQIPVKVTGNPILPSYSYTIVTEADAWTDKIAKQLELSWDTQKLSSLDTSITARLKVKNATNEQTLTQLDVREGIGVDYKGILLAQFKIPNNITEKSTDDYTGTYDIRVISGIPDRKFGEKDQKHDFLYMPVVVEKKIVGSTITQVWLNNNLGADYSNMRSEHFNPLQQAKSVADHRAYGSLFQWQRSADGHELIKWINTHYGHRLNITDIVNEKSDSWTDIGHSKFITMTDAGLYEQWVKDSVLFDETKWNLWKAGGETNPCPEGFHVPTGREWTIFVAWNPVVTGFISEFPPTLSHAMQPLKLPFGGTTSYISDVDNDCCEDEAGRADDIVSFYWSSEAKKTEHNNIGPGVMGFHKKYSAFHYMLGTQVGLPIRCIADN